MGGQKRSHSSLFNDVHDMNEIHLNGPAKKRRKHLQDRKNTHETSPTLSGYKTPTNSRRSSTRLAAAAARASRTRTRSRSKQKSKIKTSTKSKDKVKGTGKSKSKSKSKTKQKSKRKSTSKSQSKSKIQEQENRKPPKATTKSKSKTKTKTKAKTTGRAPGRPKRKLKTINRSKTRSVVNSRPHLIVSRSHTESNVTESSSATESSVDENKDNSQFTGHNQDIDIDIGGNIDIDEKDKEKEKEKETEEEESEEQDSDIATIFSNEKNGIISSPTAKRLPFGNIETVTSGDFSNTNIDTNSNTFHSHQRNSNINNNTFNSLLNKGQFLTERETSNSTRKTRRTTTTQMGYLTNGNKSFAVHSVRYQYHNHVKRSDNTNLLKMGMNNNNKNTKRGKRKDGSDISTPTITRVRRRTSMVGKNVNNNSNKNNSLRSNETIWGGKKLNLLFGLIVAFIAYIFIFDPNKQFHRVENIEMQTKSDDIDNDQIVKQKDIVPMSNSLLHQRVKDLESEKAELQEKVSKMAKNIAALEENLSDCQKGIIKEKEIEKGNCNQSKLQHQKAIDQMSETIQNARKSIRDCNQKLNQYRKQDTHEELAEFYPGATLGDATQTG